jgi:hypothetical protein
VLEPSYRYTEAAPPRLYNLLRLAKRLTCRDLAVGITSKSVSAFQHCQKTEGQAFHPEISTPTKLKMGQSFHGYKIDDAAVSFSKLEAILSSPTFRAALTEKLSKLEGFLSSSVFNAQNADYLVSRLETVLSQKTFKNGLTNATVFISKLEALLMSTNPAETAASLTSFVSKVETILFSSSFSKASVNIASLISFASILLPTCMVAITASIIYAQVKFSRHGSVTPNSHQKLAEVGRVTNSMQSERRFVRHVHDFVASRIRAASRKASGQNTDYFFIFHPGTDWHAPFERLLAQDPLLGIVGKSHTLELLKRKVAEKRRDVGKEAIMHILMPSTHAYTISERVTFDPTHFPLVFEGTLAYTGKPYV